MKAENWKFEGAEEKVRFDDILRLRKDLDALKKSTTKGLRRENLNWNLLTRFGKEMWVYMLVVSVTCGFAVGIFLVNASLTSQIRDARSQQCVNVGVKLYR